MGDALVQLAAAGDGNVSPETNAGKAKISRSRRRNLERRPQIKISCRSVVAGLRRGEVPDGNLGTADHRGRAVNGRLQLGTYSFSNRVIAQVRAHARRSNERSPARR